MGKDAKYVVRLGVEEREQLQAMIDELAAERTPV